MAVYDKKVVVQLCIRCNTRLLGTYELPLVPHTYNLN